MSIYTWNPDADDRATRELAMRHDRSDLVSGLDLAGTDDEVADVLMGLARLETHPRVPEAFREIRRVRAGTVPGSPCIAVRCGARRFPC